jgi:hypothetical protein
MLEYRPKIGGNSHPEIIDGFEAFEKIGRDLYFISLN